MKTIGLIGGLTYLSTLDYYRLLNEMVNEKLGDAEAGKIILYSVNFGEIKALTQSGQWGEIETIICEAAKKLQVAGADCILIGANTMHKIADQVQQVVSIPVIHVAEVVGHEIKKKNLSTVALLGTKYTMQLDFYKNKLAKLGIQTLIPNEKDIDVVNDAIYNEMSKGNFLPETKEKYMTIINKMIAQGAEGIILGCTEIPILIKQNDCPVPVFDTTRIHSQAAVDYVLEN